MPLYETESLVLKSYNLAEADRIVVFLTREHGIVRGVAKGAKRLKSKYGSSLELFSTIHLTYFQKEDRELVSIQQVELLRSFFVRASDPDVLSSCSYFADLLTSLMPPHDPNETVYRMVNVCIDSVCGDSDKMTAIRLYFELWLLRLSGYLPDWSRCTDCGRTLNASEDAELKIDFRLLCVKCGRSAAAALVSGQLRKLFADAMTMRPGLFADSYKTMAEAGQLSSILRSIISQAVGREIGESAAMGTSK